MRIPVPALSLAALLLLLLASPAGADASAAWRALSEPGHALLIRHANAPGSGDPSNFELGDCSTQRNLDDRGRGRAQARRLGERLRAHGVDDRPVYTSRWCRARDTARGLEVGPVQPFDGLNSFFGDAFSEDEVMPQLRAFLRDDPLDPPPVLVTHQVVITALTGLFSGEGEMIVIRVDEGGQVSVVGRIPPEG